MGTYGVHDPSTTVLSQAPECIFFCFLSNKREERDYLLSLFVLLYVELVSFGTPHPATHTHVDTTSLATRHTMPLLWGGGDGDVRPDMKSLHFWFFVVTFNRLYYYFFFNKIDGFYWLSILCVSIKIQRINISHFFHFNLNSALLSWMKITKNTCKIASFPIFLTLTFSRFYLFSALLIFINDDIKNKHFPFFPL
jgi:hypothetical protein